MTQTIHPPAPRPCASCPYRRDVPSGVWHPDEYAKLPDYDEPTPFQPTGVFLCHQVNGRACAGWAGCHDMTHNLAIRLAESTGDITPDDADELRDYTTDVELFATGREAAEHGMRDVEHPTPDAVRTLHKITRRRATTTHPIGEPK